MTIYTKTGDKGETSAFKGKRLSKDDVQIEAYGTIDELTTSLGMILSYFIDDDDAKLLTDIQRDLYMIMSLLSGAEANLATQNKRISVMEKYIDEVEREKPSPKNFILMQGSRNSVVCHNARTVSRRAERRMVSFLKEQKDISKEQSEIMLKYLNRLSDMLYAMGRMYNTEKEVVV